MKQNVDVAYAVIRVDYRHRDDHKRWTVNRVVWSKEEAVAEVRRLSELLNDAEAEHVAYTWQSTFVSRDRR